MVFKINNIFKILGILLIIMSFTVLANAQTFNLNCSNGFNCSVKSYCQSSGIQALQQAWSSSSYTVTSNSIGEHTCNAYVQLTAFGQGGDPNHQNQEVTSIYLNGVKIGTTQDKYANSGDPNGLTFCGVDQQTLGTATVVLNQTNTVKLSTVDSHGIISVTINCTPTGKPTCDQSASPRINNLLDKEISYNSNFTIDLWNHVSDPDNQLSDLNLSILTNNNIAKCSVVNNRYLECYSDLNLGQTIVSVKAVDPCGKEKVETFKITVKNNPPVINVPNQIKSCATNLTKFLDLRNYSYDENKNAVDFNLVTQSNTNLLNCSIEDDFYLSCNVNTCSENSTNLVISITDIFGETDDTNFNIKLTNFAPTTTPIPNTCIYGNESQIINLKNYFTDVEDGNNLTFIVVDQNTNKNIDCTINNNQYLSCNLKTNALTSNLVKIRATDSGGKSVDQNVVLKTNCSGNFSFSAPQVAICLEKCTSYTTQIELENKTNENKYFSFDLKYNNHFEVSLGKNNFWLSPGQKTSIPLSAMTCTNDNDTYNVEVKDYDNNISLTFEYEVGTCSNFDGFRLTEYENKVCKGEIAEYSVDVLNRTNELKIINLTSENQLLLPYFKKNRVILNANESETVQLVVNAKHAPIGKYNIFLGGDADNYHIEKRMVVEVVDCSGISERNLLINSSEICYDVEKGGQLSSSFTVKRLAKGCSDCKFDLLGVDLSIFGMDSLLSFDTVYLEGGQEKIIDYTIFVPKNASAGIHLLEINGNELKQGVFDNKIGFVDKETICINVLGESNSQVTVKSNVKDIVWCGSEIFELEIKNTGDFDETFSLSAFDLPVGVTASFSETTVTVKKGETKIVYVSIATNPDSIISDNQSISVKLTGTVNLTAKIYFNIKEKLGFEDLEFLSATELLSINTNESKNYELIIRNNSDRIYRNVEIDFENMPFGLTGQKRLIESISPGEIVTVSGYITAGNDINGEFRPAFVIKSFNYVNKKVFRVLVTDNKPFGIGLISGEVDSMGEGNNLLALFSFGGIGLGLGLAIFLLLILLSFVLLVFFTSEEVKEEVWVEG